MESTVKRQKRSLQPTLESHSYRKSASSRDIHLSQMGAGYYWHHLDKGWDFANQSQFMAQPPLTMNCHHQQAIATNVTKCYQCQGCKNVLQVRHKFLAYEPHSKAAVHRMLSKMVRVGTQYPEKDWLYF